MSDQQVVSSSFFCCAAARKIALCVIWGCCLRTTVCTVRISFSSANNANRTSYWLWLRDAQRRHTHKPRETVLAAAEPNECIWSNVNAVIIISVASAYLPFLSRSSLRFFAFTWRISNSSSVLVCTECLSGHTHTHTHTHACVIVWLCREWDATD